MDDYLLKNGTIVDGSGQEPFHGDVAVKEGKIREIGRHIKEPAKNTIDAEGRVICPGFIDVHTHDDLVLFQDPYNRPKLLQGVTTVVAGNCGFGPCPSRSETVGLLKDYAQPILGPAINDRNFKNFSEYARALQTHKKGQNVAALLAHGAVYICENGFEKAAPDEQKIEHAQALVRDAMEAGALGLSAGFMYAPGCYCRAEDLVPLAKTVAKYHGLYCVHMRSESAFIDESIQEVLATGMASGVALHISHFKVVGKKFWGRMKSIVDAMEEKIRSGVNITYDMYPYTAGGSTMSVLFPIAALQGGVENCLRLLKNSERREKIKNEFKVFWDGTDNLALLSGWENVCISALDSRKNQPCLGKSILDIAGQRGVEPEEACLQLYEEEQGKISVLLRHINEQDMLYTIQAKNCMVSSDGLPVGTRPHPRLYGTFPAFLRIFVREKELLPIEKAIPKITSFPARRFGLKGRGLLAEGCHADIAVFDPETFNDRATYEDPCQYPVGLDYVLVNGRLVVDRGQITQETPGQYVRCEHGV